MPLKFIFKNVMKMFKPIKFIIINIRKKVSKKGKKNKKIQKNVYFFDKKQASRLHR